MWKLPLWENMHTTSTTQMMGTLYVHFGHVTKLGNCWTEPSTPFHASSALLCVLNDLWVHGPFITLKVPLDVTMLLVNMKSKDCHHHMQAGSNITRCSLLMWKLILHENLLILGRRCLCALEYVKCNFPSYLQQLICGKVNCQCKPE